MKKREKEKIVYKGKYLQVSEELINGHIFERVVLRSGVHILPIEEAKVLLIHEERPHEKQARWKLISGWVDKKGKTILEHAQEELAEEIAHQAKIWEEIKIPSNEGATVCQNIHYFIARGLRKMSHPPENPDSGKILSYRWFSQEDLKKGIMEGRIYPSRGVLLAYLYLDKEFDRK